MPLAYFKDGAQMQGTTSEPGALLGGTSSTWAREAIPQTGGRRQAGGFSPSVMGAFASNGARLLPLAAYMGYKMWGRQTRRHPRPRPKRRASSPE
jgi:hypothetical protein